MTTGAKIWSVINCISSSGHLRLNPLVSQSYFKMLNFTELKKQKNKQVYSLIQNGISAGSFTSLQRSEVIFLITGFGAGYANTDSCRIVFCVRRTLSELHSVCAAGAI